MNEKHIANHMMIAMGVFLAVATIAVLVWARLASPTSQGKLSPLAQAGIPDDGGVPVQRERIDDYTARVAKEETFEELAAALNEHEDLLVTVSMWSDEAMPEMMFEVCLANRRLARLFGILEGRNDADRACRGLFRERLEMFRARYVREMEVWERGIDRIQRERPDLDLKVADLNVELVQKIRELGDPPAVLFDGFAENGALSGAVFLSAEFCPVDEVLRQLDAWEALGDELLKRCDAVPRHRLDHAVIEYFAYPQSRFQLNLLASMLHRRFGIDPGGTWEEDEQGMEALRAAGGRFRIWDPPGKVPRWMVYRKVPLCAWDSRTNPFDFTHQARGVPVDDAKTFGEFLVYTDWGILPQVENGKQRVFNELRQRLLAAAKGERGNR